MLASTLSRPRCAMPMTAPSSDVVGGGLEDGVEDGDEALAALEPKRFWPTYLVARNFSKASAALSRLEDVALVVGVELVAHALDLLLDPVLLVGLLDVHVLDADRAAVGVAQHVEDVAESRSRSSAARPPVRNSRSRSQMVRP